MEKRAGWMFRYRGQIPVFLILCVIPFVIRYDIPFANYPWQRKFLNAFSMLLILSGTAFRFYVTGYRLPHSSGRNRKNQVAESLNQLGAYAMCQHPLYFANFLLWVGIALISNHTLVVIGSIPLSLYIHFRLIRTEQSYLSQKFGDTYTVWSNKTPVFWPSLKAYKPNEIAFNTKRVFATEYPTWVSVLVLSWGMIKLRYVNLETSLKWDGTDILFLGAAFLVGLGGRFYKYVVLKKKV